MTLGEKIKKARMERSMTQSALTGNFITRNMLSRIESGSAVPSFKTIEYLAGRLDMPIEYFFSHDDDDFLYRRRDRISEIRTAYAHSEFELCLHLCLELDSKDDEIMYLCAQCSFFLGKFSLNTGGTSEAFKYFKDAEIYSRDSIYTMSFTHDVLKMYMFLISDNVANEAENIYDNDTERILYLSILRMFDKKLTDRAVCAVKSGLVTDRFFAGHLGALVSVAAENYSEAVSHMEDLLADCTLKITSPDKYRVMHDIEIYCAKLGNYEKAYKYSVEKNKYL